MRQEGLIIPQQVTEAEREINDNLFATPLYVVNRPRKVTIVPYYVVHQPDAVTPFDHSGDILFGFDESWLKIPRMRVVKNSCSILGSFRFKDSIDELISKFGQRAIQVLAPPQGELGEEVNGFKKLKGDGRVDEALGEAGFLSGMAQSSYLYIYNQDQYVGRSTCMEINIAKNIGIPMFSKEPLIADPRIDLDVTAIDSVNEEVFGDIVLRGFSKSEFPKQSWVKKRRGSVRFSGFSGLNGRRGIVMLMNG